MDIMPVRTRSPIPPQHDDGDENRRTGRIVCEMVECGLGEVIDASASGLRVRGPRCPRRWRKGPLRLRITGPNDTLSIDTKVVWMKRIGFRKHEIGLELLNADDDLRQALRDIVYGTTGGTTFYTTLNTPKRQAQRKAG